MGHDEFEFDGDGHIALLDVALVLRKAAVADFVRVDHAIVGQIRHRNVERCNVLNTPVRALTLNCQHFACVKRDLRRTGDASLAVRYGITPCTVVVLHILLVAVGYGSNARKGYSIDRTDNLRPTVFDTINQRNAVRYYLLCFVV